MLSSFVSKQKSKINSFLEAQVFDIAYLMHLDMRKFNVCNWIAFPTSVD